MVSPTVDDYTVAWICALPLEAAAARAMLDKTHALLPQITGPNAYELGELNGHHIVIAYLPNGVYGTVSAAAVVSRMRLTFTRLQFGLMVGVGGGVPSQTNDIRLGDVVVSKPGGKHGGVIQYDYGKAVQGGQFEPTGILNQPPQVLLTHMSQVQAKQMTGGTNGIWNLLSEVLERNPNMNKVFSPPEPSTDYLFCSSYHHADKDSGCEKCDQVYLIPRRPRTIGKPYIHYGLIASGDQVMKDSETRDRLSKQHGILCFEMEAAGLMNELPTLVIRGICDYCDSHKQKQWQGFAALTAAAYAKLLLLAMPAYQSYSSSRKSDNARYWMVSLPRNPRFVGRRNEIGKLEEILNAQNGPRRIAITGLGGVGKTQVALELAYRLRDQDMECSVFWVPSTSHAMVEQSFVKIAQMLGLCGGKPADVKEQVQTYLSSDRAGKWILIFDNADDTEMWLPGHGRTPVLEDLLPQSEQGRILFTTRNWELAVELTYSNIIPIPDVDKEAARNIFESLLVQKSVLDDSIVVALLEQLAFLPLAIAQAAAYINKKRLDLATYLKLLQNEENGAAEILSEDFGDPGRYRDIENAVITTWLVSFKQIRHQDPLAADFLSFIACIDPRNIPQSLLPAPRSEKKRLDALGLLDAYSFTARQETAINMHRLVHIATRNWLRKNGQFSHWIQRVADQLEKVFPDNHYSNRRLWRDYLPHALTLLHENEFIKEQGVYIDLVQRVADCLTSDGRCLESEGLYKKVLAINETTQGPKHPSTLRSIANLASTYRNQGRWDKAEELQVHVMKASKTVLGDKHPDTLTSIANLASTYRNQGHWDKAEELQVHVMEASKTVLGDKHPSTLTSIANLASTYRNQGQWDKAEELQVQVMEASKTVLGDKHPSTLTSMANLASTYWYQGRWDEAKELEVHVMQGRKIVLGDKHPSTLTSIANLASTYRNQGQWDKAEELQVHVMEASKTVLGDKHPSTLTSIANLASTYRNQGRWEKAEELEVQVIEASKTVLGDKHPSTLTSIANLASTYWNQGRWDEAEELQVHVMEASKTVLGDKHPSTLTSIANLASTYRNQGRWDKAEELQVHVMEASKTVLGDKHPDTLSSMANLASTYRNQGRWGEAEELEVYVMEATKTVLGDKHPSTLTSIANLALTYWNQGRWDKAKELQVHVMEASKKVLGDKHPSTLTSMANLAHTLESQGSLPDALTLLGACCRLRNEVLGPDHPHTRNSVKILGHWQSDHDLFLSERLQLAQSEVSLDIISPEIAPAIVARPYHLWHVGLAPAQGRSVPGFLSGDHALVIASRAPTRLAGGQAMQDVD
jgi:nucleoside phosphorylase/tetratricopeptide (TPR) repeat protein